jgi:sigma-B regulation protein RsbU (phosphoserine phosphatase)
MTNSITTRLIVLLTGCMAVIFAAGMLLDYHLSRTEILERVQLQSRDTIQSAITDMENWLDGVEGSTLFLARILEQRDYTQPGLEQMLKDIVENNEDIFGASIALNPELVAEPMGFAPYYFHRDGILTYASLAGEKNNYRDQAWFKDPVATGKPVWVEPYFDEGGGEVLMTTFAVPVFRLDENSQRFLYAVVTSDIRLTELRGYLRRLRLGEHGNAMLLSRAGIILGTRDRDHIMRHYSDVTSGAADLATWQELVSLAVEGNVTTRSLECAGIPGNCIVRLGSLESTGWPVGIRYSEDEMLAPLRNFQVKTLALGLATLLLTALAIYVVTHRLTRPLSALAQASDEIARGELNARLPRVRGKDEIAILVDSFTAMTRDLKRYIADLESATASRSRLEGELNAAREIQMSLLPQGGEAIEEFEACSLWAKVRPARSVGGDLYTYFPVDSHIWIAVGDVSDKGVPAALFMAKAISLIPQLIGPGTAPEQAMARLNDALEQGNDNCMFVTLFLGVLDPGSGELRFATAGHTPPSLLRGGSCLSLPQDDGPALGLAPGLEFPANTLRLKPGDRLTLFTDGVEEAFNASAEMFGIDRFNRLIADTGQEALEQAGSLLFKAVDQFAGEVPQSDDITILLLQIAGQAQRVTEDFQLGDALVTRALAWLEGALQALSIPVGSRANLPLVLEEIITNVDKYGKLAGDSAIRVDLRKNAAALIMEVSDEGAPFNPLVEGQRARLGADINSADIGGLGVHLIAQLTDQQSYQRHEGRNVLRVAISLEDGSVG